MRHNGVGYDFVVMKMSQDFSAYEIKPSKYTLTFGLAQSTQ